MSNVPSVASENEYAKQKGRLFDEAIQYVVDTAADVAERVDSQHSVVNNDSGSVSEEEHLPTKVTIRQKCTLVKPKT